MRPMTKEMSISRALTEITSIRMVMINIVRLQSLAIVNIQSAMSQTSLMIMHLCFVILVQANMCFPIIIVIKSVGHLHSI